MERRSADVEGRRGCQADGSLRRKENRQCDVDVQNQQNKFVVEEELKKLEEDLQRVKESDLEKAARRRGKAKTGVDCDGFHP